MSDQRRKDILKIIHEILTESCHHTCANATWTASTDNEITYSEVLEFLVNEINSVEDPQNNLEKMSNALEDIYDKCSRRIDQKSRELCQIARHALNIKIPDCFKPYPYEEDPYYICCMDREDTCPDSCRWKKKGI